MADTVNLMPLLKILVMCTVTIMAVGCSKKLNEPVAQIRQDPSLVRRISIGTMPWDIYWFLSFQNDKLILTGKATPGMFWLARKSGNLYQLQAVRKRESNTEILDSAVVVLNKNGKVLRERFLPEVDYLHFHAIQEELLPIGPEFKKILVDQKGWTAAEFEDAVIQAEAKGNGIHVRVVTLTMLNPKLSTHDSKDDGVFFVENGKVKVLPSY